MNFFCQGSENSVIAVVFSCFCLTLLGKVHSILICGDEDQEVEFYKCLILNTSVIVL